MKKIMKLSLAGLEKESVIMSMQEQMSIYAGSGIDGLCYFEGLEILSGMYGCNYSESYYINNYASTHGGYGSIMDSSGHLLGVDASSANSYLTTQFYATTVSMSNYSTSLAAGNRIMTTMMNSDGTGHAIIITGINANGTYNYSDANGGGTVSSGQLNTSMSMAVSGGIVH